MDFNGRHKRLPKNHQLRTNYSAVLVVSNVDGVVYRPLDR